MEEEKSKPKWEGEASVELEGLRAEQVWPLLEDFCNLHKWLPTIDISYQVEGVPGKPGLIRYCSTTVPASSDGGDETTTVMYAKEQLTKIDPIQRCLSYQVLENNVGIKWLVGTFQVLPVEGDEKCRCKIRWSFVADPPEGWKYDDMISYYDSSLRSMAKRMEEALISSA
ncbi:hypothetical protein UlMin_034861 [Ulmus minor]